MLQERLDELRSRFCELRRLAEADSDLARGRVAELFSELETHLEAHWRGSRSAVESSRSGGGAQAPSRPEALLQLHLELQAALASPKGNVVIGEPLLHRLGCGLGAAVCEFWRRGGRRAVEHCERRWAAHTDGARSGAARNAATGYAGAPEFAEWIEDVEADPRLAGDSWLRGLGLRTLLRVPVRTGAQRFGSLRVYWRERRPTDALEMALVASAADRAASTMQRQRDRAHIEDGTLRWSALVEATSDAVISLNGRGRVVEFNGAAEALLGHSREDVLGGEFLTLAVPERLRGVARACFERIARRPAGAALCVRFESFALCWDGSELPVEVAAIPFGAPPDGGISLCLRDATQRLDAESDATPYRDRLRALMAELLVSEERERKRAADDLHEGLSQTLALSQMKLSSLRASRGQGLDAALQDVSALLRSADLEARAVGFELSPPVLHHLGLAPALRWLAEDLNSRYGVEIELALHDEDVPTSLDEACRIILFRSIRELLINAARHSGVERIHLGLSQQLGRLSVTVVDAGVGMDLAATGTRGTGLLGIRELLAYVDGTIRVESAPGQGTKVRLSVPLPTLRAIEKEPAS